MTENWREKCAALQNQLDEMTRRNNEHNNYINSVFSSMEDGFFLTDTEERIVLFNRSAESLLGIHGSCLFDGGNKAHNATMRKILEECRSARIEKSGKTFETKNDIGFNIQVNITPVMSKYGERSFIGILAIVKDITERKKVESLRKEFVSTVSHEFRTPLTLISGFIEMLKMYDNLSPEDRNRSLEILEIETERLKKLISELLLLSKMENKISTERRGSIDVEKMLRQVLTVLAPFAEKKRQALEARISLQGLTISGNETWLFHAIHNLVENAIKYTQEGGFILVEASPTVEDLAIAVSDNGIGIAEEDRERIFERFYRVDQARSSQTGGSGLGLAIVKDIIAIFDGSIAVSSEQGKGSTFTLRIPLDGDRPRHQPDGQKGNLGEQDRG